MMLLKIKRKIQFVIVLFFQKLRELHKKRVLKRFAKQENVFILGVQKSGTTAIAALLAEATRQPATLDIVRAIKRPGSRILRNYGVEGFDDFIYRYRKEFSRKIVKEPGLTFDYHQLKANFPKAQYVMVMREPKDNIRSILDRLKIPGNLINLNPEDWPELRHSPAWRMNLDSVWLGHWPETYVDSLAYRWRVSAETYTSCPESFVLVHYEDFLNDKKAAVEGLAESLGLQVVGDISDKLDKQYQPKGKSIKDYHEYFGRNLLYIEDHCTALGKELGYEV